MYVCMYTYISIYIYMYTYVLLTHTHTHAYMYVCMAPETSAGHFLGMFPGNSQLFR